MARKYNSSRRKQASEQTRSDIIFAALKLHREGVTDFEALAREANCSVATVRKNFPTRESLFQACTKTFAEAQTMPDPGALSCIEDPVERLQRNVSELCRMHEAMLGYAWLGAHQRDTSPALDAAMQGYEDVIDAIVANIISGSKSRALFVRGLLDFMSYHAMRVSAGLSADACEEEFISTLDLIMREQTDQPAQHHPGETQAS